MRAIVVRGFGPPSLARVEEVPMPPCGDHELVIRVAAAGVNPVDWKECEGALAQFFAYPEMWIPGLDAAGTIERTGAAVTAFRPGDRVVAFSDRGKGHNGTFAEYLRVLDSLVAIVPPSVPLDQAAAIPTAAVTGFQALLRPGKGALEPGQRVFIHGASGGIGSYAVQFAKAKGAAVAASCSAANRAYVEALGADIAIDYNAGRLAEAVRGWAPDGVDIVLDCVSGGTLPDALDAMRPGARLIRIPTLTQDGDTAREIAEAAERGFTMVFAFVEYDQVGTDLGAIVSLIADGAVRTPPLTRYPFEDAPRAMQRMKDGGVQGKIVLTLP